MNNNRCFQIFTKKIHANGFLWENFPLMQPTPSSRVVEEGVREAAKWREKTMYRESKKPYAFPHFFPIWL